MSPANDANHAAQELKRLAEEYLAAAERAGVPAMNEAVDFLYVKIQDLGYPPAIPGSRYGRTDVLRNRWTRNVDVVDGVILGQVGTNVDYAPWVVGPDHPGADFGGTTKYQATVHQKRWWQFEPVMEANVDGAWAEFENAYWPALKRELGGVR